MHLTLGVAPVKRGFLSMEAALAQKNAFMARIRAISPACVTFVDADGLCENGIACARADAEAIVARMQGARVDALFLPFCDFGEETVAAAIAAPLGVPTLVWGPRDEAPNLPGARGRDTQCGILAATKVLARFGVTYSYIVSSRTQGPEFAEGYLNFLRAVSAAKAVRGLRVLKIGDRPAPFMSVTANEGLLSQKFGVVCVPVAASAIAARASALTEAKDARLCACVKEYTARVDAGRMKPEDVVRIFALKISMEEAMRANGCAVCASACWNAMKDFGVTPCAAMGELAAEGLPVSCEGDVCGAVTLSMLRACAFGEEPPFFADLTIRHPQNDNAELLWHCGPFPYALKAPDSTASLCESNGCWRLKNGEITVARLDDENGAFRLFAGEGRATDGPETTGTYVWLQVDSWPAWEETLVFGPYIHHVGGAYGKYARALREAARFLGIAFDAPGAYGVRAL